MSTLTDFKEFSEKEFKICENAAAILNKNDVIPCTGCDYCADCPKEVKISSIFSAYNKVKTGELTKEEGKALYNKIDVNASECIRCCKCSDHCPQAIDIPDKIKEVNSFFEI